MTVMQSYADLHSSQGNLCNTSEECRQSNEGPVVQGNDNSVNGFNDQSTNTVTSAASSPETGNKTKPTTTTTNLNVCKVVVDPTGRNLQPSDFKFTFSTLANPNTFQGDENCNSVAAASGQYEFSETGPAGINFTKATSGDCSISTRETLIGNMSEGETHTCTIVNTIKPESIATLNVCKAVVNPTGSNVQPSDFTFLIFPASSADPNTFLGDENCTEVTLRAGDYSLSEFASGVTFVADGFEGGCSQVGPHTAAGTIGEGETITCKITNRVLR